MNNKAFLKLIMQDNRGIALLMVLTSVTILTALLADFTFETKVNKIKVYNMQEKLQAKLNAEAGLNFAIARLRLYKESFNYLEGNEDAKKFVGQKILNQIWEVPFAYPVPVNDKMSARAKAAIADFTKETVIQGEMTVTIKNISNLININLLRAPIFTKDDENENNSNNDQNNQDNSSYTADFQIQELLKNSIEAKRDTDEFFEDKYGRLEPQYLVSSIKYFISEQRTFEDDNTPQLMSEFEGIPMALKFTPFTSKSELNLLAGWDDEIIALVENEITAHGAVMIDLNRINDKMLRILIPDISEEQTKEFFEYRDDPENPHYMNSLEDFKNYIVTTAGIMSDENFTERFDKLKKNGLLFGPSPTLFEVNATGSFNNAIYNLTAIVTMPAEPEPSQEDLDQNQQNQQNQENQQNQNENDNENENENQNNQNGQNNNQNTDKAKPIKLMEPRVVEIYVN